LRVRTLSAFFFSLTILAIPATPALAVATGGVATGGVAPGASSTTSAGATSKSSTTSGGATPKSSTTPPPPPNAAPVTARTPSIRYKGSVYQKTVTGQLVPYQTATPVGQSNGLTGGSPVGAVADAKPELLVPGSTARYVNGIAAAPMSAPAAVQEIVWAGDDIVGLPYIYGGGHASFESPGYDCSGTVSFALHGASLLAAPEDSSEFMAWGSAGVGQWVTIFSNAGHAYMTVAGLRLDTSSADDPSNQQGPRWRPLRPANAGFTVRHPVGL
jgi:hypothetical protein